MKLKADTLHRCHCDESRVVGKGPDIFFNRLLTQQEFLDPVKTRLQILQAGGE